MYTCTCAYSDPPREFSGLPSCDCKHCESKTNVTYEQKVNAVRQAVDLSGIPLDRTVTFKDADVTYTIYIYFSEFD